MTLLSAVNDAQRELSLAVTTTLVADGQETQNLLYRLARKEAQEVLRRAEYTFPALRRTQSFTTSLASLQSSGKPSDFKRAVPDTFWNQTQNKKVYGPLSDEEWGIANGAAVSSATWQNVMFRYDGLHIFPVPTAAETVTFDYVINTPVQATGGGSYKTNFTADNDEYLLGDELLTLAVVWRYLQTKGRDYAEALKDYEMALASEAMMARTPRILAPAAEDLFWPPDALVPDTGYG